MGNKTSVKGATRRAKSEDKKGRSAFSTSDSFNNFVFKLGVGADNPLTTSTYGYNPITRIRTMLEWMYRGAWVAGTAVDVVADDMTRAGVSLEGGLKAGDAHKLEETATALAIWSKINETIKWGRLYGGAIAVMLIDGQAMETPLRLETIGKDQFKGLAVLDRWMVDPSLEDLITEMGPDMGLPKYYRVMQDAPALRNQKIHYSRIIRIEGVTLPYQQKLTENMWGLSVLERLYDRMIAFDSATTGAAQLVYKSYLRTISVEGLRDIAGQGGQAERGMLAYFDMMRRFQSIEGLTLIDSKDKLEVSGTTAFTGLSKALDQFGQQLAGALQIPLTRFLGQTPGGLNSSGDSEIRNYYDSIGQRREKELKVGITKVYRAMAQSCGIKLPDGFYARFNSLWQLSETEKADIAEKNQRTVSAAKEDGTISPKTAMMELKKSSEITGTFTTITEEDIEGADEELPSRQELIEMNNPPPPGGDDKGGPSGAGGNKPRDKKNKPKAKAAAAPKKNDKEPTGAEGASSKKARDSALASIVAAKRFFGLDVAIENEFGSTRRGTDEFGNVWESTLAADYGYVRSTHGADADELDCFIGPSPMIQDQVYIIDQRNLRTRAFDEHKVMLGFPSRADAIKAYLASYANDVGTDRIGSIAELNLPQFSEWMKDPTNLMKPASGWFGKLKEPVP